MSHLPVPPSNSRSGSPGRHLCALALAALALTGCTNLKIPYTGGGTTVPIPAAPLAGNWQFDAVTSTGTAPFTALSGPLNTGTATTTGVPVTASMLAQSSGCYFGEPFVPLQGTFASPTLTLFAFSVSGQYLVLQGTVDTTGTHLSAPFKITGGCADGVLGTITGTRYDALTGAFTGTVPGSSTQTLQLTLTQSATDPDNGTVPIAGSATFGGFPCFTTGTAVTGQTFVTGSTVVLLFNTNDPNGATVAFTGTMDPAASTLSFTQVQIIGGACAATLPATQLLRSAS